ncbi:hypothetical protein [Collinsella tanakaei]|uniref:Uncharacterized protein n=1 Tax=Collinsella tanakaei YIT 12063 TaxID=742742 RepID=G1WHW5_9ACTN|nr:hypothetical protein [Collinsella tanakaei]EGX71540.1 hypothetical protein HMPREF9452_00928 [Collinsella tanakaei YIT 12063]
MIPIDAFMALYDALPGSDEIELQFFGERPHDYMVIKDEDCAIFQAYGNGEHAWVSFPSIGDLIAADLPDGICLARDWDELEVVIVDSAWVLPNEWDIADLEKRFSISLG